MKSNLFYIEEKEFGKHLYITSEFNQNIIDYILNNDICSISVDYFKGGSVPDYKILKQLPEKIVGIGELGYSYDFSYLYHLKNLKYFYFTCYTRNLIDFTMFPKLEDVAISWWPKAQSVFQCKSIKKLYITGYKGKDFKEFINLIKLEHLRIGNTPISTLSGINNLKKLNMLGLYYFSKLKDISDIESLSHLEEIEIYNCKKISDITPLSKLHNLKILFLNDCGNITSLKPIRNLDKLEFFLFYGTTKIIDGDLDFLKEMNIKKIAFANRRHYSLKNEDLKGHL